MDDILIKINEIYKKISSDEKSLDAGMPNCDIVLNDIDFLYFILEIQKAFGIRFTEDELTDERIFTFNRIVDLIRSKTQLVT